MTPIDVPNPRILVVDDDQGTRRTLSLILGRKGFEVVTASTAEEALAKARNGPLNVGLLDIRLPDGRGVELLKPLRSRHPDMELIMITGYASTETAMQALNDGATAYITKPLNIDEVLAEVGKILEKQRLVAEKRAAENQVEHINSVLRAIRSVNQLIVREKDRGQLIQGACDSLVETRGYLSAVIAVRGAQDEAPETAAAGLPSHTSRLRDALSTDPWPDCCRRAIDRGGLVISGASSQHCETCALVDLPDIETGVAAPLQHEGRTYGVLLVTAANNLASEEERSLIREVSDDIALGLHGIEVEEERAQVNVELEDQTTRLEWLTSIQTLLSQAESAEEILTAAAMMVDLEQLPSGISLEYFEYKPDGEPAELQPKAVWEDGIVVSDHPDLDERRAVADDPLAQICLRSPVDPIFLADTQSDHRASDALRAYAEGRGFRSALLMPLRSAGRQHGVVKFLWADAHRFSRAERFYAQQLLDPLSAVVGSRRAHLAHARSESRYRALFDNATDAIMIHDEAGKLLEVNHVACEQLGYSRGELLAMKVQDISGEQPPLAHTAWMQDVEGAGSRTFETVHIRKDGTEVPVEVSGRPIDYRGRPAILCAARDISERLAMEEQLHRQERLAAVGQLAGGIAHDFRNFLTTIILYSGMPLAKLDISSETRHALEVIANEAQQASDLVQQILDFSGRSAMEMQPVNLADFVEEATGILQQTIPESIKVSLTIEPSSSVVEADPTRIQQVLMNLVLNARDAMTLSRGNREVEGGELEIGLSELVVSPAGTPPVAGMEPGEWVRLTVSDTGTGMTEEVKERIFEPFFTTKERGEGTGLGLAQVYGIVQQHDGHIDVETELGIGTAFHVYLPIHGAELGSESEAPAGELPAGRGQTILLVEDQENLRDAGRGMLASLGYRVVTAPDGREALEILDGMRVDLIVTDVVMPEMGGKALIRALSEAHPGLPAIAVTGYTMRDEISELKDVGFAQVLQKPFDAQSLAEAVEHALGNVR